MGWSLGMNYLGEEVGYSLPDVCNEPDCEEVIDRGLAYCCGGLEGVNGELGCGGYFCGEHLFYCGAGDHLCPACTAEWDREHPEDDDWEDPYDDPYDDVEEDEDE